MVSTIVVLGVVAVLVTGHQLFWRVYLGSELFRNGNRLFYRDGRPNRAGRIYNGIWSYLFGRGSGPEYVVSLETTGHRSGRRHAIPVVVTEHEGHQYIVSMLGERSPWVRNVRESGGHAVIRRGSRRNVRLVDVPVGRRAPIIKAFLRRAPGARPHIHIALDAPIEDFERLAPLYPVFFIA